MRKEIKTSKAPLPTGAYSQAVVSGSGALYASSQMPMDPLTRTIPETIGAQTAQVLTNISKILNKAGYCLDDIVKVTVFLSDPRDFEEFNNIYKTFFNTPFPARSVINYDLGDELIEMDVIAQQ